MKTWRGAIDFFQGGARTPWPPCWRTPTYTSPRHTCTPDTTVTGGGSKPIRDWWRHERLRQENSMQHKDTPVIYGQNQVTMIVRSQAWHTTTIAKLSFLLQHFVRPLLRPFVKQRVLQSTKGDLERDPFSSVCFEYFCDLSRGIIEVGYWGWGSLWIIIRNYFEWGTI